MADFNTPFASQAGRRNPTSDEKINGFPCGPADQTLFNGLFHRLESEIGNVISFAGLTPSDADLSQLRKSIVALIDAATGGGDTDSYLLMSQATARLPIYPEMLTEDGKINVSSPATGLVRVPGGIEFLHRGINQISTEETDFNTQSSKTYHLRWNPVDGFSLKDLSNGSYNPGAAAETSTAFDSGYDDILIARVITNSSNVASITNLVNKSVMTASGFHIGPGAFGANGTGYELALPSDITHFLPIELNWARKPQVYLSNVHDLYMYGTASAYSGQERVFGVNARSRYTIAVYAQGENNLSIGWEARI